MKMPNSNDPKVPQTNRKANSFANKHKRFADDLVEDAAKAYLADHYELNGGFDHQLHQNICTTRRNALQDHSMQVFCSEVVIDDPANGLSFACRVSVIHAID
ncbi:BQ2448_4356 [Microbotryum intermedium]|uniref:BQ2448_4356 protein n=1 Tax=Microbotryum intermedium TaxID=269621 RepID=A0A238FJ50_9BASI|nr:BQ2448_4356 [Microbotryum intermedium]